MTESFFSKVESFQLETLLVKRLHQRYFPGNFAIFLRAAITITSKKHRSRINQYELFSSRAKTWECPYSLFVLKIKVSNPLLIYYLNQSPSGFSRDLTQTTLKYFQNLPEFLLLAFQKIDNYKNNEDLMQYVHLVSYVKLIKFFWKSREGRST